MLVEFIFLIFYVLQTKTLDLLGSDYNPRKFSTTRLRFPYLIFFVEHFTNCYDNLGCIETTDEWYDQDHRPVNFEPLEKHIIRTEFILIKLAPNGVNKTLVYYTKYVNYYYFIDRFTVRFDKREKRIDTNGWL